MDEFCRNSYYALVWSTTLDKDGYVKGKLINQSTKLPEDPNILYGTNNNDVMKVKTVEFEEEVSYNSLTTQQSVKFNKIVEEYILPRDVRIVVWNDYEYMNPKTDKYRIMTPEYFEEFVKLSDPGLSKKNEFINYGMFPWITDVISRRELMKKIKDEEKEVNLEDLMDLNLI